MKYRKLRIAWSVGWGVACLLLIALWVRSYGHYDYVIGTVRQNTDGFGDRIYLLSGSGVLSYVQISRVYTIELKPLTYLWYPSDGRLDLWELTSDGEQLRISVPHWFALLLSIGLAAACWLRWPNRFSLRTLLIAMTLVAVVLGAMVYSMR
jgi:hypothetical protein